MKSRSRVILGVGLLIVFGALAFLNFNRTIAPYVPIAEAKLSTGAVQVAGFPDHQAARFDTQRGLFLFEMKDDDGEVLPVVYKGVKPGNFDQAEKVVVVGRCENGTMNASQILVKCPSKYDDEAADRLEKSNASGEGAAAKTTTTN